MFSKNKHGFYTVEGKNQFLKYFNGEPKVLKLKHSETLYNVVTKNPNLLDTRLYINKDNTAIIRTSAFEFSNVEEQLKKPFNINSSELYMKAEGHLIFYTIYFEYNNNKDDISIFLDKQVMSTNYLKPPHGKVDYENLGLKNLAKQKNDGFSSLSATPTRYTIKNLEELNTVFEIITNSFQDPKNQIKLESLIKKKDLETFKQRAEYIHNLQENGQLLPKYIVNYIEKEQNYNIITTTAKETLLENRKSNKVQLEDEKPTMNLINNFNTAISHTLLYNNYSVDTQAALSQHTKTLHFIDLDPNPKNTHLDYKKKLTALEPVIDKRISALASYATELQDGHVKKERARLENVANQIKRFLKNC